MNNELRVAFAAADAAEKIALQYWRHALHIRAKSDERDLVTQADVKIDKTIRKIISASFPDHAILSEEIGGAKESAEWQWVLDPIDGTINFTMGEPIFGVSIALLHNSKPFLGVIAFPAIGERYWAVTGQGAWVQRTGEAKKRCHVSTKATVHDARFSFGHNVHEQSRKKFLKLFAPLLLEAAAGRLHFCAVFDFMNIARGGMDFYLNYNICLWDFAAAWCIVTEAGGHVLRMDGKPVTDKDYTVNTLATNGLLDRAVLQRIKKYS